MASMPTRILSVKHNKWSITIFMALMTVAGSAFIVSVWELYFEALFFRLATNPESLSSVDFDDWRWLAFGMASGFMTAGSLTFLAHPFFQERRRSQRRIEKLLHALNQAPDLVIVMNKNGQIEYINRIPDYLPSNPQDLMVDHSANTWERMIGSEVFKDIKRALKNSEEWVGAIKINDAGTNTHWMDGWAQKVWNVDKKEHDILIWLHDTSHQKALESKIKIYRSQINQIADSIPGFIYSWRGGLEDKRIETHEYEASDGISRLFGVDPRKDRDGLMRIMELTHPDDRKMIGDRVVQAMTLPERIELTFRVVVGGREKWIHIQCIPVDQEDGTTVWHGIVLDVTDTMEMGTELRKFRAVTEATSESIVIVDLLNDTVHYNPAAKKFLELESLPTNRLATREHFTEESLKLFYDDILPIIRKGESWEGPVALRKGGGTEFVAWQRYDAILDDHGRAVLIFCFSHDHTQTVRREEQLSRATIEAVSVNRTKSWLLSGLNHDLNEPLSTVALLVDGLSTLVTDKDQLRLLGMTRESLVSLKNIHSIVMEYSRFEPSIGFPLHQETLELSDILGDLEQHFQESMKLLQVDLRVVTCSLCIKADRNLLNKALQNVVRSVMRNTDEGKILIGCRRTSDKVRIEVWHTGDMESGEKHRALREDLLTTHTADQVESYGLDLSIAVSIANLMESSVTIVSTPTGMICFGLDMTVISNDEVDHHGNLQTADAINI